MDVKGAFKVIKEGKTLFENDRLVFNFASETIWAFGGIAESLLVGRSLSRSPKMPRNGSGMKCGFGTRFECLDGIPVGMSESESFEGELNVWQLRLSLQELHAQALPSRVRSEMQSIV